MAITFSGWGNLGILSHLTHCPDVLFAYEGHRGLCTTQKGGGDVRSCMLQPCFSVIYLCLLSNGYNFFFLKFFFQFFVGFYRSRLWSIIPKLWAFKVTSWWVVCRCCTVNLYYICSCCMELRTPLRICKKHSTLCKAMYNASIVHSFFYVGSSTSTTWFMDWITVLTIYSWLQLLCYCLQLHCATLLHSTPEGKL